MIFKILLRILNHPLNKDKKFKAFLRFIKWQIASRLTNLPMIFSFATRSELVIKKKLTVATGNYYCGLFEFEEMAFILHYLKEDDVFVDIGANIGSFTVLAANEVGAKSIAVEPIPTTFSELETNVRLNGIEDRVSLHNIALGHKESKIEITEKLGAMNHIALESDKNTLEVLVKPFYMIVNKIKHLIVKIDVEGFEMMVLKGMKNAFSYNEVDVVIIETNNSGVKYGFSDNDIYNFFLQKKNLCLIHMTLLKEN